VTDRIRIRTAGRAEFWKLAEAAKERGLDLAEMLDREGVLLTPERQDRIRRDALGLAADMLEARSVQQITGRTIGVTGNDVLSGVVRTLREMSNGG
jgi:hypothetical protein